MLLQTPQAEIGTQAPDFSLPDLNGNLVSWGDSLGPGGTVVAFICNHCPYVQAIISDLVADARALERDGINTIAIMSNDYRAVPSDSPRQMRVFAEQHAFGFPYLLDDDQSVAAAYGAVCTPDFFGFAANGTLQYRGRLDNLNISRRGKRVPELVEAMRQVAKTGKGPANQAWSIGCSIKWR